MKVFLLVWMLQTSPGADRMHHALVYTNAERCLSEQVTLDANLIKLGVHLSYTACVKEFVRTEPEDFIQPVERGKL